MAVSTSETHPAGGPAGPVRLVTRESLAGRPRLKRSATAGEVVLAYLGAQVAALRALDPLVRNDEPDSVHQMRVAGRRLRSTLRTFGGVIGRDATAEVAGELKWLGTLLGKARDAEVISAQLRGALHETPVEQAVGPVGARLQAHFASARAAAREEVLAGLGSQRYLALLESLDRLLASPPLTPQAALPARKVLPAAVRRAYRKTSRRMRRARHAPPGQRREAALHQARKAAKRARYAAEATAPALGKEAARFAKRIKKVQSVLGDHQDAVVARQVARELGMSAHLAGENAYTYGVLYARGTHAAQRHRARAAKAWRKASRRRHRRWLR